MNHHLRNFKKVFDNMFAIFIYILLMFLQVAFFTIKKAGPMVMVNSVFQLILSVGAYYYANSPFYSRGIFLYPFLMLFFLNIVANYAMQGKFHISRTAIDRNKFIKPISQLYLVFAVIFIVSRLGDVFTVSQSGDYAAAYLEANSDDAVFHTSLYEQLEVNYLNYLMIPVLLYGFCCVINKKAVWGVLLLLTVLSFKVVWGMIYASRTQIVIPIVLVILVYMMFKNEFSKKIRKKIRNILLYSVVGLSAVVILISISRFEGMDLTDWIFLYVGASIMDFHDAVLTNTKFTGGSYFFGYFKEIFPQFKMEPNYTTSFHAGFLPTYARLYTDFKWWWVLVFLPVCCLFHRVADKKTHSFAGIYILLVFFVYTFIGNLYSFADFTALIVYFIVYIILSFGDLIGNKRTIAEKKHI